MDTGTTSHITKHKIGGINHRGTTVNTRGFVRELINPELEMDILVKYIGKDGLEIKAELKDMQVNKNFNFNLFSVTKMLKKGYLLSRNKKCMKLKKGAHEFTFESVIRTRGGVLYCAIFKKQETQLPESFDEASVVLDSSNLENPKEEAKKRFKINVKQAHEYLGHLSEDTTRKTALQLRMNLSRGALLVCESCTIAKARQRNVPKETSEENKAQEYNGQCFHDIATIKVPEKMEGITTSEPNWHILIDEALGFKQSKFHILKGAIIPDMCQYMHSEKERGFPIQILRQENAKENVALIKIAKGKDWKHNFKTEVTARNTPQQNLKLEMAFTVIPAQARTMLISPQIPDGERFKLWPEVTVTATFLNNLVPVTVNRENKTRGEHTGHKILLWVKFLQTFDEAGTVKEGKKGKVLDRGITMMLVGYDNEHNGNCYRMYNPVTSRVVITQDVIWFGRVFYTRLPHKLDHKSMPVVLVPISMNTHNIEDKSMQTLEVITRIVPASDKRGGSTIDCQKRQMPNGQLTGQDPVA